MSKTNLIGLAVVVLASFLVWLALSPAREASVAIDSVPTVKPEPAGNAQPPTPSGKPAEQNPFEAPSVAGLPVERPQPVPQDEVAAAARERQAEQGDARAQVALGNRYLAGNGVPMDEAEALRWYRAAADQGLAAGQVQLGSMYEQGQGTAKDLDAANEWYTMAAAQGDPAAQANLGDLFEFGDGYINYKQASYWYRQAAKQGYPDAQRNLGRLYETGRGVEQDYRQAYLWYALAAARGDAPAARNRDLVAGKLLPVEVAEAQKLAQEWRPKQLQPQPTTDPR